ncbi:MAG: phytoene/squalene synthase family protein [Anaerolineales bacterium]|nr:phytoene/squalene synthase family protein [Anaerolineales bacterium]
MTPTLDLPRILKETSRTFAIPISRLPARLQAAVACAYLCMRAIDEIEDHPGLDNRVKASLLEDLSLTLQASIGARSQTEIPVLIRPVLSPYRHDLPEVSRRLGEWIANAPADIALRIIEATAAMADRMAYWARRNWQVQTEADLDGYTFSVAGAVGLLLCDLWAWFDNTQLDRTSAVQFGRGLQMVNIIRNREEDLARGVDYYPDEWTTAEMLSCARRTLSGVSAAATGMPVRAYKSLVEIPLLLANATLNAIEGGQQKLTRLQVLQIISQTG